MGSQMVATLRGTCVELHDEGCAIHFRALEFTLHPDPVHFQLPLAVHKQPTVDTKLHNGEQRLGQPEYVGAALQGRMNHVRGWVGIRTRARERAAWGSSRR